MHSSDKVKKISSLDEKQTVAGSGLRVGKLDAVGMQIYSNHNKSQAGCSYGEATMKAKSYRQHWRLHTAANMPF